LQDSEKHQVGQAVEYQLAVVLLVDGPVEVAPAADVPVVDALAGDALAADDLAEDVPLVGILVAGVLVAGVLVAVGPVDDLAADAFVVAYLAGIADPFA
jgi:hypothetical protein